MKCIFTLFLFCILGSNLNAQWQECNNGLYAGNVNCIVINGNEILAGTSRGIYKSTDNCESWKNIGFPDTNVQAVAILNNKIFVGTEYYGLFITTNEGNTWTAKDSGLVNYNNIPVENIYCFGVKGNYIFAGTMDEGIYLSTDFGNSWNHKTNGFTNAYVLQIVIQDNTVFACVGGGIYHTTNNGDKWDTLSRNISFTWISSLAINGNFMFAGSPDNWGSLYKSSDYGKTWNNIGFNDTIINSVVIINNNIYLGTSKGIFFSTDNGNNWTAKNSGLAFSYDLTLAVNGNEIIAGTQDGGIYLTTDNGDNWKAKNTGLVKTYAHSMAINGNEIFVGTGNYDEGGGIFKTTDNGNSWEAKFGGLYENGVWAVAIGNNHIFAGTAREVIYSSTDDGETWKNLGSPGQTHLDILSLALNDSYLFAGAYDGGVFRSSDFGNSWKSLYMSNGGQPYSLATNGNNIFSGTDRGLYVSSDNGDNWREKDSGIVNPNINSIVINGNNIYAGAEYGGVYCTKDNGDFWKYLGLGNSGTTGSLTIDSNIFIGTNKGLYYSSNFGNIWTNKNTGSTSLNFQSMLKNNNDIFIGSNDGVYLSTDLGNNWQHKNAGLENKNVTFLAMNKNCLIAGTDSNGIYISTDYGNNWIASNNGLKEKTVIALTAMQNYIFTIVDTNGIYISSDNGNNWNLKNSVRSVYSVRLATNGSNVYAGTDGGFFISTDAGENWVKANIKAGYVDLIAAYGNVIYFSGSLWSEGIYASSDNGKNWNKVNISGRIENISINENNILVSSDIGLYLSSDLGKSWSHTGIFSNYVIPIVVYGDNIIAGTNNGAYISTDNGIYWSEISGGLPNYSIFTLAICNKEVFAGTYGGGVYKAKLSDFGISDVDVGDAKSSTLNNEISIYPNPTDSKLIIELTNSLANGKISYSVTNMLGIIVKSGTVLPEQNRFSLDVSNLQTGIYFLTIISGNNAQTYKFIKR
ncbi:MAG: T9SS type A sorting domain-containing protein [FCB group bacterium]